jgi:hypothetical protein
MLFYLLFIVFKLLLTYVQIFIIYIPFIVEWHRVACDKGFFTNNTYAEYYSYNPDPDGGQDFSDDCITAGDNSIQNMLTTDRVMIIRPSAIMCPNKYAGTYRKA